jgi:hypothetical protein
MELGTFDEPARVWKRGEQVIADMTHPAKMKVHTTGLNAQTLLDEGPAVGKHWAVTVRVEVRETTS